MRSHRRSYVGVVVCGALLAALLAAVGSPTPAGAAVPPGFELAWGSSGSGNDQFNLPVGVASSGFQGGTVYVLDYGNARVLRFTVDGAYVDQFGSYGSGNRQLIQPGGIAVGPDGSVYVADTGNQRIVKYDAGGNYQTKWGTYGTGNGQFNSPGGVAADPVSGDVFVADTLNHRIQKFTATGTYKTKWGIGGTANGRFRSPSGIAVSADRKVYVADTDNNRVQQFTGTGVFQRQWGALGSGDGQFDSPHGVTVDTTGNVYVADSHNHRVQQFSATGAFLSKWGSDGTTNGLFASPLGIGVAPDGVKVLVADTFNHRVQRFGALEAVPPGVFIAASPLPSGDPGPNGEARRLGGIEVSSVTGNLYAAVGPAVAIMSSSLDLISEAYWPPVETERDCDYVWGHYLEYCYDRIVDVDVGTSNVVRLQTRGFEDGAYRLVGSSDYYQSNYEGTFKGVERNVEGNVLITNSDGVQEYTAAGNLVRQWGTTGSGHGQFQDPRGLTTDIFGRIYVSDFGNDRIEVFGPTGNYIGQFGAFPPGEIPLNGPTDIAFGVYENVFVADYHNHRVVQFAADGTYMGQWGTFGSGDGQFNGPTSISVGPGDDIYVTDSGNNRIQRFAPGSGPGAVATPAVSLSADQASVSPGDPIDYHLTVTNTTPSTLTGVRVSDPGAPDCERTLPVIEALTSAVVDCTYNTGADDAGPYANTATVQSDQTNAVNSNTVTTQVGPAVTVTMTAPTRVTATGSIPYAIAITNNSALPLTGVRVNDPAVPGCAGPIADIAPGATANVNCTKTTTDADSGSTVFNAVTVDALGAQAGLATAVTRVQGRVTGTITGPGGPVAGAYVLALSRDFLPLQGDTVANGSGVYNLGLDPGRYFLAFLDPSGATQAEYYNNKTSALALTSADLVTVNVGSGPATANATLAAGFLPVVNPATISGTVTDANGPVAGVWVVAVNGGVRSATRTNAAGQYTVGNLPAGNAYLEFADPPGTHAFRWYLNNDGTNPTAIPVTAGQHVTGINQVLPPYP